MAKDGLGPHELEALRVAGRWGLLRDLAGARVCLTGKMTMPRAQVGELIEAAGGQFSATVSSDTRLLVAADGGFWTSKMSAAEARGVRVMRETEFAAELLPTPAELLSGERARFGDPR